MSSLLPLLTFLGLCPLVKPSFACGTVVFASDYNHSRLADFCLQICCRQRRPEFPGTCAIPGLQKWTLSQGRSRLTFPSNRAHAETGPLLWSLVGLGFHSHLIQLPFLLPGSLLVPSTKLSLRSPGSTARKLPQPPAPLPCTLRAFLETQAVSHTAFFTRCPAFHTHCVLCSLSPWKHLPLELKCLVLPHLSGRNRRCPRAC